MIPSIWVLPALAVAGLSARGAMASRATVLFVSGVVLLGLSFLP